MQNDLSKILERISFYRISGINNFVVLGRCASIFSNNFSFSFDMAVYFLISKGYIL